MSVDEKRNARRRLRTARENIPGPDRDELSAKITEIILGLDAWRDAKTVMIYLSLPSEVHTDALAEAALSEGKCLALPRVREQDGRMEAVHVTNMTGLGLAALGKPIWQPLPGVGRVIEPEEIDLNLVPCVGVTPQGDRLGMGGGHYDRLLKSMREDALSLGLVYSVQVVESLPTEPHDQCLAGHVSEKGLSLVT